MHEARHDGSFKPPPLPSRLEELEKQIDPDTHIATTIRNVLKATTYVDLLYLSVCSTPYFPILFEIDGLSKEVERSRKNYLKLAQEALAIAKSLREEGIERGERVALLFLGSTDLFSAFYGCMLVGVIPIVLPPPIKLAADLPKFNALVKKVWIKHVISHNVYYKHSAVQTVSHRFIKTETATWPTHLKWLYFENLNTSSNSTFQQVKDRLALHSKSIEPEDIAYLQLTSSRYNPKAVIVPHSSLILSISKLLMTPTFPSTLPKFYDAQLHPTPYSSSTFSSPTSTVDPFEKRGRGRSVLAWVPAHHDFYWGLWGAAQLLGYTFITMSPMDFLIRPGNTLKSCYRYRTRITGFPNFGLDYVVNKCSEKQKKSLKELVKSQKYGPFDTIFYLGGQVTRHGSVSRFLSTFPFIEGNQMINIYGKAESVNFLGIAPTTDDNILHLNRDLLSQGTVQEIEESDSAVKTILAVASKYCPNYFNELPPDIFKVVGKGGEELEEGTVGEIWVCCWSRGLGYWGSSEEDNIGSFHSPPPRSPSSTGGEKRSWAIAKKEWHEGEREFHAPLKGEEVRDYLRDGKLPPFPLYLKTGDEGFIYKDRVYLVGKKSRESGSGNVKEKEPKTEKAKKQRKQSLGLLGSPKLGRKRVGKDSMEDKEGKKGGAEKGDLLNVKERMEDGLIWGGGVLVGFGEEKLGEGDKEEVVKLFSYFPMLKERWEDAERQRKDEEGRGAGGADFMSACLSALVVTSLEITELRNVVYDLYNVYVPIMFFQTAIMQEMTIGDFYIKHIKSAPSYTIKNEPPPCIPVCSSSPSPPPRPPRSPRSFHPEPSSPSSPTFSPLAQSPLTQNHFPSYPPPSPPSFNSHSPSTHSLIFTPSAPHSLLHPSCSSGHSIPSSPSAPSSPSRISTPPSTHPAPPFSPSPPSMSPSQRSPAPKPKRTLSPTHSPRSLPHFSSTPHPSSTCYSSPHSSTFPPRTLKPQRPLSPTHSLDFLPHSSSALDPSSSNFSPTTPSSTYSNRQRTPSPHRSLRSTPSISSSSYSPCSSFHSPRAASPTRPLRSSPHSSYSTQYPPHSPTRTPSPSRSLRLIPATPHSPYTTPYPPSYSSTFPPASSCSLYFSSSQSPSPPSSISRPSLNSLSSKPRTPSPRSLRPNPPIPYSSSSSIYSVPSTPHLSSSPLSTARPPLSPRSHSPSPHPQSPLYIIVPTVVYVPKDQIQSVNDSQTEYLNNFQNLNK